MAPTIHIPPPEGSARSGADDATTEQPVPVPPTVPQGDDHTKVLPAPLRPVEEEDRGTRRAYAVVAAVIAALLLFGVLAASPGDEQPTDDGADLSPSTSITADTTPTTMPSTTAPEEAKQKGNGKGKGRR